MNKTAAYTLMANIAKEELDKNQIQFDAICQKIDNRRFKLASPRELKALSDIQRENILYVSILDKSLDSIVLGIDE